MNVPNTSATGGFLSPGSVPAPLEGQALLRFVQQWFVGVTGMDGTMVRPRWQPEPPNIPSSGLAWAAVGITSRPSDTYPYVGWDQAGAQLQRHELLNVLSSFYGLGAEGPVDGLVALMRDGASIPQNREYLAAGGFALIETGEPVAVPSLLKRRWLYRVDLPVVLRRQVNRTYPVLSLKSAQAKLYNPQVGPDPQQINVDTPEPTP